MRIVVKAPYYDAFECEIPNSLNAIQSLVGGYIELVELDNEVDMYVDELGLIKGKQPSVKLPFTYNGITKMIPFVGTVIFCSHDDEDFASLDDEQLAYVLNVCEEGAA